MSIQVAMSTTSRFDELVPNQPVTVALTIFNSGATTVTVTNIVPYFSPPDGGVIVGQAFTADQSYAIPAASSKTYTFKVVFTAPIDGNTTASDVPFTLGATVYADDGSTTIPAAQVIRVRKGQVGGAQPTALTQGGSFNFASAACSGALLFW